MVGTLLKRVERAEQGIGDNPCPRCTNTTIFWGLGKAGNEPTVSGRGFELDPEASWRYYLAEQPSGACPMCKRVRENVTIELRPGSSFFR